VFSEIERPKLFEDSYTDKALYLKYDKAPVYYMLTRRGDAMELHIAAEGRKGKLALRESGAAIINWLPKHFKWCKMAIAPVGDKSVYNLCIKLGFADFGQYQFENGMASVMGIKYEQNR
jgi:hypothetical protein